MKKNCPAIDCATPAPKFHCLSNDNFRYSQSKIFLSLRHCRPVELLAESAKPNRVYNTVVENFFPASTAKYVVRPLAPNSSLDADWTTQPSQSQKSNLICFLE